MVAVFTSVGRVGAVRPIVGNDVAGYGKHNFTGNLRGNIAIRKKEKSAVVCTKKKNSKKNRLNPGDDSSIPQKDCDMEPKKRSGKRPRCHFCGSIGVVVGHFLRRDYSGGVFSDVTGFEKTPYP